MWQPYIHEYCPFSLTVHIRVTRWSGPCRRELSRSSSRFRTQRRCVHFPLSADPSLLSGGPVVCRRRARRAVGPHPPQPAEAARRQGNQHCCITWPRHRAQALINRNLSSLPDLRRKVHEHYVEQGRPLLRHFTVRRCCTRHWRHCRAGPARLDEGQPLCARGVSRRGAQSGCDGHGRDTVPSSSRSSAASSRCFTSTMRL